MLFHSVAMVCDLSPCYNVFPKLQIRDQTLYCGLYCKRHVEHQHVLSQARASEEIRFHTFQKDITDQIWIKHPFSSQTRDAHML